MLNLARTARPLLRTRFLPSFNNLHHHPQHRGIKPITNNNYIINNNQRRQQSTNNTNNNITEQAQIKQLNHELQQQNQPKGKNFSTILYQAAGSTLVLPVVFGAQYIADNRYSDAYAQARAQLRQTTPLSVNFELDIDPTPEILHKKRFDCGVLGSQDSMYDDIKNVQKFCLQNTIVIDDLLDNFRRYTRNSKFIERLSACYLPVVKDYKKAFERFLPKPIWTCHGEALAGYENNLNVLHTKQRIEEIITHFEQIVTLYNKMHNTHDYSKAHKFDDEFSVKYPNFWKEQQEYHRLIPEHLASVVVHRKMIQELLLICYNCELLLHTLEPHVEEYCEQLDIFKDILKANPESTMFNEFKHNPYFRFYVPARHRAFLDQQYEYVGGEEELAGMARAFEQEPILETAATFDSWIFTMLLHCKLLWPLTIEHIFDYRHSEPVEVDLTAQQEREEALKRKKAKYDKIRSGQSKIYREAQEQAERQRKLGGMDPNSIWIEGSTSDNSDIFNVGDNNNNDKSKLRRARDEHKLKEKEEKRDKEKQKEKEKEREKREQEEKLKNPLEHPINHIQTLTDYQSPFFRIVPSPTPPKLIPNETPNPTMESGNIADYIAREEELYLQDYRNRIQRMVEWENAKRAAKIRARLLFWKHHRPKGFADIDEYLNSFVTIDDEEEREDPTYKLDLQMLPPLELFTQDFMETIYKSPHLQFDFKMLTRDALSGRMDGLNQYVPNLGMYLLTYQFASKLLNKPLPHINVDVEQFENDRTKQREKIEALQQRVERLRDDLATRHKRGKDIVEDRYVYWDLLEAERLKDEKQIVLLPLHHNGTVYETIKSNMTIDDRIERFALGQKPPPKEKQTEAPIATFKQISYTLRPGHLLVVRVPKTLENMKALFKHGLIQKQDLKNFVAALDRKLLRNSLGTQNLPATKVQDDADEESCLHFQIQTDFDTTSRAIKMAVESLLTYDKGEDDVNIELAVLGLDDDDDDDNNNNDKNSNNIINEEKEKEAKSQTKEEEEAATTRKEITQPSLSSPSTTTTPSQTTDNQQQQKQEKQEQQHPTKKTFSLDQYYSSWDFQEQAEEEERQKALKEKQKQEAINEYKAKLKSHSKKKRRPIPRPKSSSDYKITDTGFDEHIPNILAFERQNDAQVKAVDKLLNVIETREKEFSRDAFQTLDPEPDIDDLYDRLMQQVEIAKEHEKHILRTTMKERDLEYVNRKHGREIAEKTKKNFDEFVKEREEAAKQQVEAIKSGKYDNEPEPEPDFLKDRMAKFLNESFG